MAYLQRRPICAQQDAQQVASTSGRTARPVAAPRQQQRSVRLPTTKPAPRQAAPVVSRAASTVANFQSSDTMALTLSAPSQTVALPPSATSGTKTLSWAGAGIYFFWQCGAMKYLSEHYDLSKVPMVGASGGALASILGACEVPADLVLQRAYELSHKHKIWDRPLGLLGVWGALVEEWLDDLLPEDAAERCRGRVTVVVTTLPTMEQVGISDFKDKQDLINCAMASSHIPIFLDYKFARYCRGKYCIDGSFPDFFVNDNSELLKNGGAAVMFDYFQDPNLKRKGRMDMIERKTYDEICHIMDVGYQYAAQLHATGHFDHMELGEMMLDHLEAAERV